MKKIKNKYFFAGIFFLILQLILIIFNLSNGRLGVFYWFCNHTPMILAIGFFLKDKNIIKSIINVGFIAQFFWGLDLVYSLITQNSLFDITPYVFQHQGFSIIVPPLVHLFSTNLALIITIKEKPTKKTLLYSLIYTITLYLVTLILTNPIDNVNCIHEICVFRSFTPLNYNLLWVPLVFLLIILPTQLIQYLFYLIYKKRIKSPVNKKENEIQPKT